MIFNQLVGVANELPRYQQNIHNKLEAMRAPGDGALGRATASVKELGKELSDVEGAAPRQAIAPDAALHSAAGRPQPVQIVENPRTN